MPLSLEEIQNVLKGALPFLAANDIQRAAEAIRKAAGNWKELDLKDRLGAELSVQCRDICAIGQAYQEGVHIRAFICKE